MLSKYKCAIPARVSAGRGCGPPVRVCANQWKKRSISEATLADGGASKCTRGFLAAPETTCIGSLPVRYLPTSFTSRRPETIILCQRNNVSRDSGSRKEPFRSTIISAIPCSAGRTRRSSTVKPSCFRIEDCTLARSRISPSISEVVTASVLMASTLSCCTSSFAKCLTVPRRTPPPTRNCCSAFSRRARFQVKFGQSECCQFQAMSDRPSPYRSQYGIFVSYRTYLFRSVHQDPAETAGTNGERSADGRLGCGLGLSTLLRWPLV